MLQLQCVHPTGDPQIAVGHRRCCVSLAAPSTHHSVPGTSWVSVSQSHLSSLELWAVGNLFLTGRGWQTWVMPFLHPCGVYFKIPIRREKLCSTFCFFSSVLDEWQGFKKQFKKFGAVGNTMDSRTQVQSRRDVCSQHQFIASPRGIYQMGWSRTFGPDPGHTAPWSMSHALQVTVFRASYWRDPVDMLEQEQCKDSS